MTWPGGSNAFGMADWCPLAGRKVTVWPDADEAGCKAANAIAKLVMRAGAASIGIVPIPDGLPDGWDLTDPIPGNLQDRGASCFRV
jgi:putative DNA primase/helicase